MIGNDWDNMLSEEFSREYFSVLIAKVENEYKTKIIYPERKNLFNAFKLCDFSKCKVVIIGQDPYHGENEANGLAFSVNNEVKTPPSLRNLFKELDNDLNIKRTQKSLEDWALQGVLLMNSIFTVEKDKPASHRNLGWEEFSDNVIKLISSKKNKVVFVLLGNYAKTKEKLIDTNKHIIIKSVHPSPLSASRGFFGSKIFSEINRALIKNNLTEINWN